MIALRTAAASSVSIKHLARADAKVIGIIGAGHQATFQLRAALKQRAFGKVIGWNFHHGMLPNIAKVAEETGVPFEAVDLDGMRAADVTISITSSFKPILSANQIAEGCHIACMGTDTKGKQEVVPDLLQKADVFSGGVAQSMTIGEAQHFIAQRLIDVPDVHQLGGGRQRYTSGPHVGRSDHAV